MLLDIAFVHFICKGISIIIYLLIKDYLFRLIKGTWLTLIIMLGVKFVRSKTMNNLGMQTVLIQMRPNKKLGLSIDL